MKTHSMKKGTNMARKTDLQKAIELVEARKAELKGIPKDQLSYDELEECFTLGIYTRPKEVLPVKFAKRIMKDATNVDGAIVLPKLDSYSAKDLGTTEDEMKKAIKFWNSILPIIVREVEAKLKA